MARTQLETAEKEEEGVNGIDCLSYRVPELEDALIIQGIMTDCVMFCGPRLLGWPDTESVVSVLFSWLSLLEERDALLRNSGQHRDSDTWKPLKDFAETLLGGLCSRDGYYHKTTEVDLSDLEDWIKLSLTAKVSRICVSRFPNSFILTSFRTLPCYPLFWKT